MKRPRLPAPTESALQRSIVQALPLLLKPGVVWTHFPAGGARDAVTGARLKAEGLYPGWPDLQFVYGGRIFFLEVKTRSGRLSTEQRVVHARLRSGGAHIGIVRSIDDVSLYLRAWWLARGTPDYRRGNGKALEGRP